LREDRRALVCCGGWLGLVCDVWCGVGGAGARMWTWSG
jgi:hypothetical protein